MKRNRPLYLLLGAVVIILGLGSRSDLVPLSPFVAKYAGDALWALLVFLGFGFIFSLRPTWFIVLLAVGFSCAVEFSQFYRAPWIDALRRQPLGHLVLGDTFAWGDIAAYLVGIVLGVVLESLFAQFSRR